MRTQVRTIALIAATVVVLGALLVLFVRVRSAPEIVVPEDALSEARARYEREHTETGNARASESSAPVQADRSPAAPRPPQRPPVDEPSAEERRPRRSAAGVPPLSGSSEPAPASDTEAELNAVRIAYDHGDFELALELAEKFLSRHGTDDYIKRVAVVSACAVGEEAVARRHYQESAARDQALVAKRCSRYGVRL
jgi:hypothetical protein